MDIFKKTLTIPPAETGDDRIVQLQDEINRILTISHFRKWSDGKQIDLDEWKITYPDGAGISIVATEFVCLIGNREIQVDSLEEAEEWLWANFSASQVDIYSPSKLAGFSAGFKPRRFSSSESLHAGMCLHSIPMGDTCTECAEMANG